MSEPRPEDGRSHAERRRDRERAAAESAAAAGPSAARWLWPSSDGGVRPVDVVADLLALDPRTRLRGRGDAALRAYAATLDELVQADVHAPSGRPLLEIVVADPEERLSLQPTFSLDALFGGPDPRGGGRHDRTVRLAVAALERARAHRAGEVDLHAEVAPVGLGRHPRADEVETLVAVAVGVLAPVGGPDAAIVVSRGGPSGAGWIGVSPVELFLTAARGLLVTSDVRDLGGSLLAGWLAEVGPHDAWWAGLRTRLDVDASALLEDAARQAGSDHADVVGPVLADRIASRYPLAPG